jgi:hypothetical protein
MTIFFIALAGPTSGFARTLLYGRVALANRISSAFTLTPNAQAFLAAPASTARQQPEPGPDDEQGLRVIAGLTRPPTLIVVWPLPRATGF